MPAVLYETRNFMEEDGEIRLERWLEGLVLWVGGEIVWKSFEPALPKPPPPFLQTTDETMLRYDILNTLLREGRTTDDALAEMDKIVGRLKKGNTDA